MKVLYSDVAKFYGDKEKEYDVLKRFNIYHQKENGYIDVANAFMEKESSLNSKIFKLLLEKRQRAKANNSNSILKMQTFCYFDSSEINDILKITTIPNQKWHLYVSYFAYQELNTIHHFDSGIKKVTNFSEEKFTYYSIAKCPELLLWMAKAAGINDDKINDAIDKAIEAKKKNENACAIIRKIIPWDEIANLISGKNLVCK